MGGTATDVRAAPRTGRLAPYVPGLIVDWLRDQPDVRYRRVPGTFVFADISGFTALTERLSARGKAGAEETGDMLNWAFDHLLTAAYDYGANLIKWGGDAVLLLFDGDEHLPRGCRAAAEMQAVMRRIGRLETSRGVVRLGISIGVHTGDLDLLLVGDSHRELIVTGPAATTTARMEHIARRGEVVLSTEVAAALPAPCRGKTVDDAVLLARPPEIALRPNRRPKRGGIDLGMVFCESLRTHLLADTVENEHRLATIGFLELGGTDDVLATAGVDALVEATTLVLARAQAAADANDVTLLASDLTENGAKLILACGVPRATGDDATRMISTLRAVLADGGPLRLRAGVACGAVFAGDYGPFYRKTYSVAGDIVNLAARLMTAAEPGQLLAATAVLERSRSNFETTPVPPLQVKGKRALVDAVAVGELRRSADPEAAGRLPLIGRDRELAALLEAAQHAATGVGQVVEVVGPPGIGKSRLLQELAARAPTRTLWAAGDIYGRATPYQPFQQLLRSMLGLSAEVADAVLAEAFTEVVAAATPDLLPWLPLMGIVAGLDLPMTDEVALIDPQVRRARLEAMTSEALGRILNRPQIVVFNDVHFMDDATLGLVRRLAHDVKDRPWLIVLTRRPDRASPVANADTIELQPLSDASADELLGVATQGRALAPHRLRRVAEHAGGNPLFLTQLAAGNDLDELPDSIEGVIAAQLDRLPAQRRRWLRAASVLGMTVDPVVLDELLDGTDLVGQGARGLEEFMTVGADQQLQFTHHLVRLTAYEGLPYRRRIELHARAADIMQARLGSRAEQFAALLSTHCVRGELHASAWRYSVLAGDTARDRYAPAEAAEFYRRALLVAHRVPDLTDDAVAAVSESLALACMDLGETAEAERALRRARATATGDAPRLARLMLTTARHRQHLGRHTAALRWIEAGRRILRDGEDVEVLRLRAELAEAAALVRYDQGAYRSALRWAERSVAEARAAADPSIEARSIGVSAVLAALSGQPWDERRVHEALARYEAAGDLRGKARVSNQLGMCAYFAGRWNAAVEYYAEAEQAYLLIGRDAAAATAAANRAEVLIQQRRLAEALDALGGALRVWRAANATSFLGFGTMLAGRAAMEGGAYVAALDHFAEAHLLCEEMGELDELAAVDSLVADCHLRAGAYAAALICADETLDRIRRDGIDASAEPLLLRVRGEALLALGRPKLGARALRQSLAVARQRESRYDIQASLAALLCHGLSRSATEAGAWGDEWAEHVTALGIVADAAGEPLGSARAVE